MRELGKKNVGIRDTSLTNGNSKLKGLQLRQSDISINPNHMHILISERKNLLNFKRSHMVCAKMSTQALEMEIESKKV